MTERKPEGIEWESWVERKIREAMERGDFDNLPSMGKPIPDLALPYDELWWVRRKLREEELSVLPPSLAVLSEIDEAKRRIASAGTEEEVRRLVRAINDRITDVNAHTVTGPPSSVVPLDLDRVLSVWRDGRPDPDGRPAAPREAAPAPPGEAPPGPASAPPGEAPAPAPGDVRRGRRRRWRR